MPNIPLQPPPASAPARHFAAAPGRLPPDLEPLILSFVICFDHRERAGGWRFTGLTGDSRDKYRPLVVPLKEIHMPTADYTVEGVPIFVERKSVEDFIGTITHGRENFEKEHERMRAIEDAGGACCVIIEGSYDQILRELESGMSFRNVPASVVRGSVAAQINDHGIPWLFAGNRRAAEEMAFVVMRKAWERQQAAAKEKLKNEAANRKEPRS